MGTWGTNPLSNDMTQDVIDGFDDYLKKEPDIDKALETMRAEFEEELEDEDTRGDALIGLAERLWQYGKHDEAIFAEVREICLEMKGQELWQEEGAAMYRKRKAALEKFWEKISKPKAKPKKLPKIVVRKPVYEPGDCLAEDLQNGYYAALLVLDANDSDEEYGSNLIVTLAYYDKKMPTLEDFKTRDYLRLTHHNWKGKIDMRHVVNYNSRNATANLTLIGNVDISGREIPECNTYGGFMGPKHLIGSQAKYQIGGEPLEE